MLGALPKRQYCGNLRGNPRKPAANCGNSCETLRRKREGHLYGCETPWHHFKALSVGIYRRNMLPGPLGWCGIRPSTVWVRVLRAPFTNRFPLVHTCPMCRQTARLTIIPKARSKKPQGLITDPTTCTLSVVESHTFLGPPPNYLDGSHPGFALSLDISQNKQGSNKC